jgi:hypothetical protein
MRVEADKIYYTTVTKKMVEFINTEKYPTLYFKNASSASTLILVQLAH